MDNDLLTITILIVLLALSACFSASETAFSSLNRIRLKNLADSGNKKAIRALKAAQNFDRFLTTILIGNNVVNISMTAIATVYLVKLLGPMGATWSTIIITVVILFFGEVSPKSIAKEKPEKIAMFMAGPVSFLMFICSPLSYMFSRWKKLLTLVFKGETSDREHTITEDELLTIVEEAESEGTLDEQESELIRSAIEFNDLEVTDIFTPRVDICGIERTATEEEIVHMFSETGYSRLPVFEESIDNIVGVVNHKDFFNDVYGAKRGTSAILKEAVFITPSMKISALLTMLQKAKAHMAVISDEFGGTVGIVTMEDILEELVGEIWDEHDEVEEKIQVLAANVYQVVGNEDMDKLADMLGLKIEEQSDAMTVNGWIIEQVGHIPVVGESFSVDNNEFKITRADNRKVLEVLVSVNSDEEQAESA
jgi:CBS domain containing-hemolysin-like protein